MDSISSNVLSYYLTRIHKFLISDEETIRFRFVTPVAEKILVKIATDTEGLKNVHIDDDCKTTATQIATVLEENIHNFTLKYMFEKTECKEMEMVYQKMPVVTKELKPLRKPNIIKASLTDDELFVKGSMMSSFKARWLNATLKFVKSDQLVLQYPNMTSEQAEFVREMISQCMTREGIDIGFGFKGLYAPLAEALRTVGVKYHLKLSRVSADSDMQCWKFEKHPIIRKKAKDDTTSAEPSKSTADQIDSKIARKVIITNLIGSQNAPLKTIDLTGSKNARKVIITDQTFSQNAQLKTTDLTGSLNAQQFKSTDQTDSQNAQQFKSTDLTDSQNAHQFKTTDLTGSQNANQPKSIDQRGQNAQIIETIDLTDDSHTTNDKTKPANGDITENVDLTSNHKKISHVIEICKSLSGTFKKTALMQLRDFIADDSKDQLVFGAMRMPEMVFLMHWKVIISRVEIIRMFGVEGQMTLDQIRYSVNINVHRFSIKVSLDNLRKEGSEKLKDVIFRKDFVADRQKPKSDTSVSTTSSLKMSSKDLCYLKQIEKIEPDFIKQCLTQLVEFLSDDAHASLVFPTPPFEKEAFLNSILELKEPVAVQIFNSSMLQLWNIIRSLLEKNALKYTVKIVRPAGMSSRDFTFRKEPYFGMSTSNSSATSSAAKTKQTNTTTDYTISETKERRTESHTRKMDTLRALYRKSEPNTVLSIPHQHTNNPNNTKKDTRNIESSIRVIPPAGTTTVRVTSFPDHTRVLTLEDKRSKPSSAKAKIIKALQQPVVSEKGSKMMRLMGWEGGALGARGDGIVEPIMPELDTAHRAGLGLFKPKKMTIQLITELPSPVTRVDLPQTPGKKEFKLGMLQTVLIMLTTEDSVFEVNFPEALTEKKWAFVRRSVNMFNLKGKLVAEDNKLKKISQDIMNVMKETDYIITASFAKTKRKIQFVKCKGIYVPRLNEWGDVVNLDHLKKHTLSPKDFRQQGAKEALQNNSDANATIDNASANKTAKNDGDNSNNVAKSKRNDVIMNNVTKIKDVNVEDARNCNNINTKSASNVEVAKETVKHDGKDAKGNICMTKHAESNIGNMKDAESNIGNAKDAKSNNFNDIQLCSKDIEKNTNNTTKDSERKDYTRAEHGMIDDNGQLIVTPAMDLIDSHDTKCNLEDDVLTNLDAFKRYIMKEILEFCKDSVPIYSNVQKRKILKLIYLKGEMNETQISCVKNLMKSFKKSPQNDQHTDETIIFDEIVSLLKGYFLEAHFPPEKVGPTEPTGIKIYKRIVLEKVFISTMSKNFYLCKLNLNASKLAKNVTNNDPNEMQSANSVNATPILSDKEINKLDTSSKGNAQDIVERQTKISSNISAMDKESSNKNFETFNKRRMTFTSDVIDEKCMFDYVEDKIEDDNISENNNNESEHKTKHDKRRTSDKFDEKFMFDYRLPDGQAQYSTPDKEIDEKCSARDSDVQIMKDKVDSVQFTDEQEVEYMVLEQQTIDVTEIEKSGTQIQSEFVKNVDVGGNLNMLKRLRSADDLLTKLTTKEKDCLLSRSLSLTAKGEKIRNVTDNDKFGKRSLSQTPERPIKKCKYAEFKKEIAVVPDNYPQTEIDKKMAGIIQKSILSSIDYKQELPLLRCLGIQNGALTYCCRTEESYNSLERLIRSLGGLQITEKTETEKPRRVMAFRINTFFEEQVGDIFDRLESYNPGLSTKDWSVVKKEEGSDYIVIQVELDEISYKYILDAKFLLHAGIDEAVFSMVW